MLDPSFVNPLLLALIAIAAPLLREIWQRRSGQMDALLKYQAITNREAADSNKLNESLYSRLETVIAGAWRLYKQAKHHGLKPEYTPPGVEPDTGPLGKMK